ncbi:MAG: PQQ-binding-like beta-propeller repeat protein [Candidatus Nealsonbacteria bacterium]|nr:PQQ-binding-like beta-propeller repeat protein [Candidatus Nealsonbacteria bacterium]
MTAGTLRILLITVLLAARTALSADDKQWSQFRGPGGTGISDTAISSAAAIPTEWTDRDYNWKVELPGVGHASPVVRDKRIFVTCGDPESAGRAIVCLDTSDGRTLWRRDYPSKTFRQHRDNSYATATPAADDLGAVLTWSTPEQVVLLALDRDGGETWRRDLGPFVGMHGSGSSPIILDDLVILANDQGDPKLLARILGRKEPDTPAGKSFLIAVDRRTGKTRWKLPRRTTLAAYSTPCVHRPDGGKAELIFTSTSHGVTAVDPATGKINWQLDDVFRDRCVGSPVAIPGLVIGGFGHGISGVRWVAVRPGPRAAGFTPALVYDLKKSVPLVPTPLIHRGRLFLWGDDGVVSCLNVADGEAIWQQRVGGSFYGSPVCVGDRLYCIAKDGTVVVLAASDKYKVLARVPLGEPSFATPAISGGVMYLRTRSHLFSLGGKTP